jgi:hypothetical protein
LKDWKDKDYSLFLREHHPLLHPFLYEMRIHIFRRDRKDEDALKAKDEKSRREALFVACKENMILEKYFGRTLEESTYQWSAEKKAQIAASIDPTKSYRSPVSAGPFQIKERTLWLGILACLGLLLGLNLAVFRRWADGEPARGIEPPTR